MSWRSAYVDLQDAFESASDGRGSQIWVAAGTYSPTEGSDESISFELVEDVNIYGGFAGAETMRSQRDWQANRTILSGDIGVPATQSDNSYHVVKCSGVDNATLDGFIITAGSADSTSSGDPNGDGAGIYCINSSSPTIANCTFSDNYAYGRGAGVSIGSSTPSISKCTFSKNETLWYGGAIYNRNNSSTTVADCIFADNSTDSFQDSGWGGAIANYQSSITISNCIFTGNYSDYAGGLSNYDASAIVKNCIFSGNTADYDGGGIHNDINASIEITNCTFTENDSGDYGGAIYNSNNSEANLTNCIVWDNVQDQLYNCSANYSCIQNGGGGTNIESDPCFIDSADPNEFHLGPDSLCIDAGDPDFNDFNEIDIDGECRIMKGKDSLRVDIGADEFYIPKCNYDDSNSVDFLDYALFADAWLQTNSTIDLDGDDFVDANDLRLFCNDWLWIAPWSEQFEMMRFGDGGMMMSATAVPEAPSKQTIQIQAEAETIEEIDIEEVIERLDEIWLSGEFDEGMTEEQYLEFRKAIEESEL